MLCDPLMYCFETGCEDERTINRQCENSYDTQILDHHKLTKP